MLQPEGLGPAGVTSGAHRVADLGVLPDDDASVDVADDELELLGRLPPVDRAKDAADLGRRQQALEHAVAVLAQPQDAIALA